MLNRIDKKFQELKNAKQKAFITFITAGYPNLSVTKKLIYELSRSGADIIELGVPFSDPIADGTVIQEASQQALKRGASLKAILSLVKEVRKDLDIPIVLMSYYNPIFCFGEKKFVFQAGDSGVDGIIIPDLPVEEGLRLSKIASCAGVDVIFLVAPTSDAKRIKYISKISRGFVYYISSAGVTGLKKKMPVDLISKIRLVKKYTSKPVCVGFGISSPQHLKQINRVADGVIVGSAIVKTIQKNVQRKNLVAIVGKFVARLKNV
jgi:tryptophan synthase alpha chain